MSLYQVLNFFMIYSVIGWMIEVSFHAVTLGKVVNRGFLNGPLCPVYGCGVLSVLAVVRHVGSALGYSGNIETASVWVLFVIGITFSTLVELIAGAALDMIFHARWWNYSAEKFNFRGYICLRFSIIWGLGIAFVLRIVHPGIERITSHIPERFGWIILALLYTTFIADIVLTTMSVLKLNKQLEKMEEIQRSILRVSDAMSEVIGTGTIMTVQKLEAEEVRAGEEYEEKKQELEEKKQMLEEKKQELDGKLEHIKKLVMYHRVFGMGRLLLAFPDMTHRKYQDMVDRIKEMTVR